MNMITSLIRQYREFILYGMIGGACATLDFIVYTLMLSTGLPLLGANAIGVCCGIVASFTLNRRYNFRVKDHALRRFVLFLAVGLSGLAVSSVLLSLLVDTMAWNELYAKLFTIIIVSVLQFAMNKTLTFKTTTNG